LAADFLADFQKAITMGPQLHSESGAQIGQVIDKRKVPVDLSFYQSDAPFETVLLFTKVVLHR
jgi:hypothetical protein